MFSFMKKRSCQSFTTVRQRKHMNFLRLYIPLKGHKQRVSTQVYILTLCTTLETCVKQYGETKHWPSRGSVLFIGGRKFRGSINFMWGAFTPIITETNHIFFYSFKTELNIYIFVIFFYLFFSKRFSLFMPTSLCHEFFWRSKNNHNPLLD